MRKYTVFMAGEDSYWHSTSLCWLMTVYAEDEYGVDT